MQHQIHPNTIRQIIFIIAIALLVILIGKQLYFLLTPLLGAITFYVLLRNLMINLVIKFKLKKWMAALLLLFASLILVVGPIAWLINFGYHQLVPVLNNPEQITQAFNNISTYVNNKVGEQLINSSMIAKANTFLLSGGQKILGGTLNTIGNLFMMYLILYFLLYQTLDVEAGLRNHLPFKNKNATMLINKSRTLIYSNAIGIPIVAIIQGIIASIGYKIFGVNDVLLFGLLTAISSVIPVLGSMLVYLPLGLFMLSQGYNSNGVGIIVWGLVLVGSADNIARFLVQKYMANVHPLITIFGALMGVNIFGFIGVIFGPILISLLGLLINIYVDEYGTVDADDINTSFKN
jgi:predicted PurR-regulated permease PerM